MNAAFNSRLGAGGPRADHRKSQRAQEFSGLAIIGLAVAAGLLLLFTGSDPHIPSWIWLALLCIALSCSVWPIVDKLSARSALMLYTTAVLSSWVLIATMPDIGLLVVVLILVAAAGVDVGCVKRRRDELCDYRSPSVDGGSRTG